MSLASSIESIDSDDEDQSKAIDPQLLITILKLEPTYKYFVWLYTPLSFIEVDKLIEIHKVVGLPDYVFLRKLVLNCIYNSMDLETTIDFIHSKGLIEKNVDDLLIVDEAFKSPSHFNKLDWVTVSNIVDFANHYLNQSTLKKNVAHDKYPMVDKDKGRPLLGWLKCYHRKCGFKGFSADHLRDHLTKCNAYTPYFHKSHESVVINKQLTPEKVLNDNLTACASPICDRKDDVMTPEELILHYRRLGIKPFWTPGVDLDYDEEDGVKKGLNMANDKPIHSSESCVACLDRSPSLLFTDCNHYVMCFDCYKALKDKACPMCLTRIALPIFY